MQWQHDWVREAVFYEVFVRSFADGDGDGVGDFRGLTAKLDYLNDGDPTTATDLGVDGLWLMPVFLSPSYHGYDVVNYERIDPDYGTEADFDAFLAAAKKRGIKVILDFVMNHTGRDHRWFQDSASGAGAARRDWYLWRTDDPRWTQPWGGTNATWHPLGGAYFYGVFWGGMPDLNFANPAVRAEMERLARVWLARGVDGFRLDATRHLFANGPGEGQNDQPETHAYLREFARAIRETRPGALLVGENWTDTPRIARYYGSTAEIQGGDELPMSFNFPLASAIVSGVTTADATPIVSTLADVAAHYPAGVLDATFLTNHDMPRLATQLGGDCEVALARQKSAAAVLLTLPGVPFLYYGEEVGLANGPSRDDRDKRTPMPWSDDGPGGGFVGPADGDRPTTPWHPFAPGRATANVAAQDQSADSVLSTYRFWIRLRQAHRALAQGSLQVLPADSSALVFLRTLGDERLLVAHNLGAETATLTTIAISGALEPLVAQPGVTASGEPGLWQITLPAGGSAVWRVR